MNKVYGTGAYDFKRHRVAEYPVEQLAEKPVEAKPGTAVPSTITLSEIQRYRLTKIAVENWSIASGVTKPEKLFESELVKEIYETELLVKGGRKPVPLQRVMILEVSQYLENYLWPNFDPKMATFEHVMSMIIMVNEKFRENVAAWACFYDRKDVFRQFLESVLRLKEGRELSIAEKINYLVFMINAFQSLEDEVVSETVLRLASLQSWHSLSYGLFQVLDSQVFPQQTCISEGDVVIDANGVTLVDDASILYCERFMEFLIDLLSQLPTRRYLRPLVADVAVVAKCHLSALYRHEKGKLFTQLVDLLLFYEKFEINDHVGTQLTDDEVLQFHYDWFQSFQLLAFKKIPKLREVALVNIGAIHNRADLSKKLSVLSPEELKDLVCCKIGAIISGIQPGLTMVVGPPGTGKTDTAVQILNVLYHNCPSQRTLIITHSNQALNDLFEKIMQFILLLIGLMRISVDCFRGDVPARYLLRLGQGEQELATDLDFSRQGRVNAMLVRRLELLSEVERLARSLQLPEDVGYTCETAGYFWLLHVYSRWEQFLAACAENKDKPSFVKDRFPFKEFFSNTPHQVFTGYPASKISILTTYNGQKLLICNVISRRCLPYDFIGPPGKVTTVDKFQGQQNDFILLSLVRTRFVGHLRDVRRLVVAMSHARHGLYVFCRRSLFEQCNELQPTFQLLLQRPDHRALNLNEITPYTKRPVEDTGPTLLVSGVEEMSSIFNWRWQEQYMRRQPDTVMDHSVAYAGQNGQQNSTPLYHSTDTDIIAAADGAEREVPVPHERNLEEDTKAEGLRSGQNGDVPLVNASVEVLIKKTVDMMRLISDLKAIQLMEAQWKSSRVNSAPHKGSLFPPSIFRCINDLEI